MIAAELLDQVVDAAARVLALPPAPRSVREFARTLRYPDGPEEGQLCDPETHPASFELLRAFAARYDEIVSVGPVQDTKTWSTTTVPLLYFLVELRRAAVVGWPDRALAAKYWRSKLLPVIASSDLTHLLPTSGPGSDGGSPEDVLFTNGARLFLLGAGAKNEAGQSMVTAPAVFVEERDSIRSRWVELLKKRAEAYGELKRLASTSTLKDDDGNSTTLAAYETSLAFRLYFRCPLCVESGHASGGYQTLEPARFRYEGDDELAAEASAHIVCAHDASHRITDATRRRMLRHWLPVARGQRVELDGSISGDAPRTRVYGLRWTALDSPLKVLGQLAKEHFACCARRDAYGDHEPLRQFYRDLWVMPYREDTEGVEGSKTITPNYLAARSNAHGWADLISDKPDVGKTYSRYRAIPPAEATFASVAIDVQGDRCYWEILAGDAHLRTWDIAWAYEYANDQQMPMSTGELHQVFDRIAELVPPCLERPGLPPLALIAAGIDVGYRQHDITAWLAGRPSWIPVAGAGDEVAGKMRQAHRDDRRPESSASDMLGVVYRRAIEGTRLGPRQHLHLIDVDHVKQQAQNDFLRAPLAPSAAHLPRGLKASDAYIMHLTGQVFEEDKKTGAKKWRTVRVRHDYLDLRTYNLALMRLHLRNGLMPTRVRKFGVLGGYG